MNPFRFISNPLRPAACICLPLFLANAVRAEFHGRDDLSAETSNWEVFRMPEDKCRLVFQNSRLEYAWKLPPKIVGNHRFTNNSKLFWTPNTGSFDEDWFVQVNALYRPPRLGKYSEGAIGIGVVLTGTRAKGYIMTLDRGTQTKNYGGFRFCAINGKQSQYATSDAVRGGLRIQYDSKRKTLTGSWKSRSVWHAFRPVSVAGWNVGGSDRFTAILHGSYGYQFDEVAYLPRSASPPPPGKWLTKFRCGPASPEITVDRPIQPRLTDGKSRLNFGTAQVKGPGVTRRLILRNDGTKELRRLKMSKGGRHARDFHIDKLPVSSLLPGEFVFVDVTFRPRDPGKRRANLKIRSNDKDERIFDIRLFGKGR